MCLEGLNCFSRSRSVDIEHGGDSEKLARSKSKHPGKNHDADDKGRVASSSPEKPVVGETKPIPQKLGDFPEEVIRDRHPKYKDDGADSAPPVVKFEAHAHRKETKAPKKTPDGTENRIPETKMAHMEATAGDFPAEDTNQAQ